ncbi:ADP-ribosylation factor-related protein 1-like protein, partial [Leptotrombidium deliense]
SHAVIYVVDSSDIDRIDESKEAFGEICTNCQKTIQNETLAGVPLLLVANKQDIPESLNLERIKEAFRSSVHFSGKRDCHSVAASAIRGEGITEAIDWLINCIKRNSIYRPPKAEDG